MAYTASFTLTATGGGCEGTKKLDWSRSDLMEHFTPSPRSVCDRSHRAARCASSSVPKATNAVRFTSGFTDTRPAPSGDPSKRCRSSSSDTPSGRSWRISVFLLGLRFGRTSNLSASRITLPHLPAASSRHATPTLLPSAAMRGWPGRTHREISICGLMCCWMKASLMSVSLVKSSSSLSSTASTRSDSSACGAGGGCSCAPSMPSSGIVGLCHTEPCKRWTSSRPPRQGPPFTP
mmetsp:Transcript_39421/g.102766  ORF Transcript_39421/g.102766 Transcript_39421/m.102766 type:complete len:235 (-) Transcript_39421:5-709(-)